MGPFAYVLLLLSAVQASLQERHHLSAAAGALAVLFRQTNAVWVAFVLGSEVLRAVAPDAPSLAALPVEKQLLHVLRSAWLVSARCSCMTVPLHSTPAMYPPASFSFVQCWGQLTSAIFYRMMACFPSLGDDLDSSVSCSLMLPSAL